ncbi:hypothetical protein FKM82_001385 [Ascaphus truei]
MHIDMEKVKLEQASLQRNEFGMNAHPHHIDNASSSRLENVTQTIDEPKAEQLKPELHGMENVSLMKRANTLEIKIKSIEKMVFRHGEDLKALQAKQRVEGMKYENTFEQQFNNMTRALNSFQNRLEEGLDIAFSQISQLRDDIYFMENALNHTKKERLGEIVTTLQPAMGGMRTRVTTPFPASQTIQIMQEDDTTTQQVSKQKEMSKERYRISLSFLKSRTDFQVFFYGADKDANGYLTYAEIRKVLGEEAPGEDALLQFDEDQNRMYSYNELIRTFQLNDLKRGLFSLI